MLSVTISAWSTTYILEPICHRDLITFNSSSSSSGRTRCIKDVYTISSSTMEVNAGCPENSRTDMQVHTLRHLPRLADRMVTIMPAHIILHLINKKMYCIVIKVTPPVHYVTSDVWFGRPRKTCCKQMLLIDVVWRFGIYFV